MAIALNLGTHRRWEDWVSIVLGLLVIVSPWLLVPSETLSTGMQLFVLNAVIAGLLIASVSALELQTLEPWEEWTNMVLGLWVAVSPWVFGYSQLSRLTLSHVVLGLLVAALAAIERWQDSRKVMTPE